MGSIATVKGTLSRVRSELRELEQETSPMAELTMGTAIAGASALTAAIIDHGSNDYMVADKFPLSGVVGLGVALAGYGAQNRQIIQAGRDMMIPSIYKLTRVKLMTWSSS